MIPTIILIYMEQNFDEEIKDKLTKVCLCKAISKAAIKIITNYHK
jgi:hypothetical protein